MLRRSRHLAAVTFFLGLVFLPASRFDHGSSQTVAALGTPTDVSIAAENANTNGVTPQSQWDVAGAGDPSIQGFATQISVNRGETVSFKIDTPSTAYRLDIYRMGYYGGAGARKVATVSVRPTPSLILPQTQQACAETDAASGLFECAWNVSAAWNVPADAVSGIYFAKAIREDLPVGSPEAASHIVFIVRNDAGRSDLLFQTSDQTWQAYNNFGSHSLYCGGPIANPAGGEYTCATRSAKVSYNRPFNTRVVDGGQDWVFNAEYPTVRFLEANGYDVSYIAGADVDRGITVGGVAGQNALLQNHKAFLSVGHDEYWSGGQRAKVEAARAAGVNLAFFSGNEIFWKTRWENGGDGSPYRTLVCYKETIGAAYTNATFSPTLSQPSWTGAWRDARNSPPKDGGRPENALTGTSFAVDDGPGATGGISIGAAEGSLRFWRGIAGAVNGFAIPDGSGVRGYEWDEDPDNGARPPGLLHLSSTVVTNVNRLQNEGDRFSPGTATHHLTLYRAPAPAVNVPGALVFGAGTIQWSWGLDAVHDRAPVNAAADLRLQQATINLLADMGVQPGGTLLAGLNAASPSIDTTPPASTITHPNSSAPIPTGRPYRISGTSTDINGLVAGVAVSTDGGSTWHQAVGTTSWSYTWTPTTVGTFTLQVRAVDDSGNLETPISRSMQIISGDPNVGPGGPILIVTNSANPFTRYYAEILRNEGFNEFAVADLASVTAQMLGAYDVVILGQTSLSAAQVDMLQQWTQAGGNLIAMRPDKQLYPLLGLTEVFETPLAGNTLSNGYLLFNPLARPAVGLVGETIQFHGAADYAGLNQAQSLATLYSDATTATSYPAATTRAIGSAGGQAAAFMFDLAKSVVYTRQGNPAWSGQERDGVTPIRSDDLYFGAKVGDVQRDWVDLTKVAIPQADEQQRLLANLILHLNVSKKPLPRFWYLPRAGKAVVVMTGDDHANGGTAGRFEQYKQFSPLNCSVDNWECVRSTSYMYPSANFTNVQAAAYAADGFEMFAHVNTGCADWATPQDLASFYSNQIAALQAAYPSLPPGATHRIHCVVWSDYDTQPQVALSNGIRLDTSYYYWPASWITDRPGLFTGSGFPMRFAKADGTLIDVYQATSQMTDESGQTYPLTADALLNKALGPEGYYGVFTANMHTDFNESNADGKGSMMKSNAIVASAQARGVPIIAARQMLAWLDGRNESSFNVSGWDGSTLAFSITAGEGANGLMAMLPVRSGALKLAGLTRAGSSVPYTVDTIKGVDYAFFNAVASSYQATYIVDNVAPVISNLNAVATSTTTALVTWTTDETANSHVDFGTSAAVLQSGPSSAAYVTAHSLTLTGLTANTTYYYRVTSGDGAIPSNIATAPGLAQPAGSFTTPPEPPPSFIDTTVADFSAGTIGSSTYISQTTNGEVVLRPLVGTEFSSPTFPPDWFIQPWATGGTATVSTGRLSVDAALVGQNALYGPGRSLEFVATFSDASQHIGFGHDFTGAPWAIFSTDASTSQVYARSNAGAGDACPTAGPACTPLGLNLFGSPHRYRIEWAAAGFTYFVDGVQVASQAVPINVPMRPLAASDFNLGGGVLVDDWFRMSPYSASGVFLSRVFDAGAATNSWGTLSWNASLPTGTSIALSVRTGNTLNADGTPDGSWTPFRQIPVSGAPIGGSSRYLQYRAALSTTDRGWTPELQDVSIQYHADLVTADSSGPIISGLTATPIDSSSAAVTWTTDQASDSRVDYHSSSATPPAATDSELVFQHRIVLTGLEAATTYTYQVTSTNFSGLSSMSLSKTFTMPAPRFIDTLVSDFSQGQLSHTSITNTGNGEVALAQLMTAVTDLSGTSLPVDWTGIAWNASGTATVGSGSLLLDGARAAANAAVAPGHSVEFVATFGAAPSQHLGFVNDLNFNSPWAIFSTHDTSDSLFARTSDGMETPILGSYIGSTHRYRIDWTDTNMQFWVDDVKRATHWIVLGTPLLVLASDFFADGVQLKIDSVRVSAYEPSGTFVSRVFDARQSMVWDTMQWTASVPAGTTLAFTVSTGDTLPPDTSWVTTPIGASGASIGRSSRYIQYGATLTSSNPGVTPVIQDVTIAALGALNHAPVAANQTVATGDDTPLPITLSATDQDSGDTLAYAVVANPTHGTLSGTAPNLTYTPTAPYDGADAFTFTATDNHGAASNVATVSITVTHVRHAPTITWSNPADIAYGTALSGTQLNATASVPGSFVYSRASGTVLNAGAGQSLSVTFTPTDTANYTTATKSVSINVLKATPTITWANPADITYGTALSGTQLNATANVPGSFAYAPAAGTVLGAGNAQTLSVTFTPSDTANYTTATKSVSINVLKATTTTTLASSPNPSLYGQSVTLTATVGSTVGTPTGIVTFKDGAAVLATATLNGAGVAIYSTTALAAGSHALTAVYGGDTAFNGSTSATVSQFVDRPPTVAANAGSLTVNEGQTVTNGGTFSDPDSGDTVTVAASAGSITQTGAGSGTWSWSATFADGPATQTITVTATDSHGATATTTFTVTVMNTPPVVGAISWNLASVDGVKVGTALTASATFTDSGTLDTHTATWAWGDTTSSSGVVSETNGSGSVTGTHTYTAAGLYTVRLTVTDKDGAPGQSTFQYVVVFDPAAGYESGAGSYTSPVGAYSANTSLTGTAQINQLIAKYGTDGTLNATSNVFKFGYTNASLTFNSSKLYWLAMSGNNSWLKGEGLNTVSGVTESCYFLLSVVNSTTAADKVRVKIWSKTTGRVVYDSMKDANGNSYPDDALPTLNVNTGPGTIAFAK